LRVATSLHFLLVESINIFVPERRVCHWAKKIKNNNKFEGRFNLCTTAKLGYSKITTLPALNKKIIIKSLKDFQFQMFFKAAGDESGGDEIAAQKRTVLCIKNKCLFFI